MLHEDYIQMRRDPTLIGEEQEKTEYNRSEKNNEATTETGGMQQKAPESHKTVIINLVKET